MYFKELCRFTIVLLSDEHAVGVVGELSSIKWPWRALFWRSPYIDICQFFCSLLCLWIIKLKYKQSVWKKIDFYYRQGPGPAAVEGLKKSLKYKTIELGPDDDRSLVFFLTEPLQNSCQWIHMLIIIAKSCTNLLEKSKFFFVIFKQ